jgi:hypothetical protein
MIMSVASKLRQSRQGWKEKAIGRGDTIRYLRKEQRRLKSDVKRYKEKAHQTKILLKEAKQNNLSDYRKDKASLVHLALQLFLVAGISFRAVSRVLCVIGNILGIEKAPSHQTIINWWLKLSMVKMQSVHQVPATSVPSCSFSNGFIWMVDISIGLGAGKILAVLALDAQHHKIAANAPKLHDVHCVGVSVASSWTGERIADFLKKIIATLGRPAAFLKDGGVDLSKSARLLTEQGLGAPCIDDVSHKIANLVKHEYGTHPLFDTFIAACGKISKRFKQSILACLVPPKVSVKARFMNLHRLVSWAEKILKHSVPGRASKDSLLSKLRDGLDDLPECKTFITRFIRDVQPLMQCQKIIKNKGLNHETYAQCQALIEVIPRSSSLRIGFNEWANEQLSIAKTLAIDNTGLPISTDQIESLFSIAKRHGTGEMKDANRIAMRLPALCGEVTIDDAKQVLKITMKQQQESMSAATVIKQRQEVLAHPGMLETLYDYQEKDDFELIPVSKNRQNKAEIPYNIYIFEDLNGPRSKALKARASPAQIAMIDDNMLKTAY